MTKALEDKQPCTMGELEGCYTHVKRRLQLEACKLQKFFQSLALSLTWLQNSGKWSVILLIQATKRKWTSSLSIKMKKENCRSSSLKMSCNEPHLPVFVPLLYSLRLNLCWEFDFFLKQMRYSARNAPCLLRLDQNKLCWFHLGLWYVYCGDMSLV